MTPAGEEPEVAVLSDKDSRTFAEIERHLQEDPALRRAFGGATARSLRWIRRGSFALLVTSLVLVVDMVVLHLLGAAVESAALAATAGLVIRRTSARAGDRARRGCVPRRSS
jgi:Protein of unknown function (DUF3040)